MSSILYIQSHIIIPCEFHRSRNMCLFSCINHILRIIALRACRRRISAWITGVVGILEAPDEAWIGIHELLSPVHREECRARCCVVVRRAFGAYGTGWYVVDELAINGGAEIGPFICRGPVEVTGEGLAGTLSS